MRVELLPPLPRRAVFTPRERRGTPSRRFEAASVGLALGPEVRGERRPAVTAGRPTRDADADRVEAAGSSTWRCGAERIHIATIAAGVTAPDDHAIVSPIEAPAKPAPRARCFGVLPPGDTWSKKSRRTMSRVRAGGSVSAPASRRPRRPDRARAALTRQCVALAARARLDRTGAFAPAHALATAAGNSRHATTSVTVSGTRWGASCNSVVRFTGGGTLRDRSGRATRARRRTRCARPGDLRPRW